MHAIVHSADIQDRDGGALLMASLFGAFPFLVKLYADGGYQGPEFQGAMKRILVRLDLEIVKKLGHASLLGRASSLDRRAPRLAWSLPQTRQGFRMPQPQGVAFLRLASIRLMLRKLFNAA